jgi:hypothetical protein
MPCGFAWLEGGYQPRNSVFSKQLKVVERLLLVIVRIAKEQGIAMLLSDIFDAPISILLVHPGERANPLGGNACSAYRLEAYATLLRRKHRLENSLHSAVPSPHTDHICFKPKHRPNARR